MPSEAADRVLKDPLSGPGLVEKGAARLREARGLADLLELAELTQGCSHPQPLSRRAGEGRVRVDVLESLAQSLSPIAARVRAAAETMPEATRASALSAGRLADGETSASPEEAVAAAARFDVCAVLGAARQAAAEVERALPALRALPRDTPPFVLDSLGGLSLTVRFSGPFPSPTPPASAGSGTLDVVVDLADDVLIEASTAAAQGPASGVLGVGLLYLANPGGTKTLRGGDVSFGAGLLGVGGLYLAGPASVEGGAFGQGAAAYGAGVVWSSGTGSTFTQELAGQGYGTTRGAGLFAHRGAGARLSCGLTRPDPRDEHATLGLCQGAGYGPRGFAGGGLGALSVDGNGAVLRAGYMAQGMGYWRAAGVLALRGDGLDVQGRRYVQGAGVHTGVGAVRYEGASSTFRVWGVGPAFGWDYGVGVFHGLGDDNLLASEWAAARGDVNGVGLTRLEGRRWRLALSEPGSGAMRRNAPSWGVVAADDALVLPSPPDPWGSVAGAAEDASLQRPPAEWPRPDRAGAARRDGDRVAALIARADAASPDEAPRLLLDALAASGLDGAGPRAAVTKLLALGPGAAPSLLPRLTPERFDDSLWVRLAFSAWGHGGADALLLAPGRPAAPLRAWRAAALSFTTLRAKPLLDKALADEDWRVRRAAALSLGTLLSREEGEEPGRLRVLEESAEVCRRGRSPETPGRLGARRLTDLLAGLSLDAYADPDHLQAVFLAAADPFDRFGADAPPVTAFLDALAARPAYADALRAELAAAEAARPGVRAALAVLLEDAEPEVVHGALTALAQLGDAEDAPRLARFLGDGRALLREAAAAGLGRMGAAARGTVVRALSARSVRERALAALAAAQSSDPRTLDLLETAFADRDPAVRGAAVRGLNAVQGPLRAGRARFKPALGRLAASDRDAGVRALAARALRSL
jgi:HEAT repeat protein